MQKTKQTPPEVNDALPASEPKSATTAAGVLPATPKKKSLEDCKTAKERIEYYKDQITEEKATLRSDLDKQLKAACDTVLLLSELGDTKVLDEDQYTEYRGTLGVVPKVETPVVPAPSGGKKGTRKPRPAKKINAAIKRAGKPQTIPEIATATMMSVAELETYFASESASQRFSKTGDTYTIKAK